jgi:hypothetical protein
MEGEDLHPQFEMGRDPMQETKPSFEPPQTAAAGSEAADLSAAKLAANRANAQKSTGPNTDEGKARSSQNAVKHGMFSHSLGIAAGPLGENREGYDTYLADLRARYQPEGQEEHTIVDRLASLWWEVARVTLASQQRLAKLVQQGIPAEQAIRFQEPYQKQADRMERAISRQRRDLLLLQRVRGGSACGHTKLVHESFERLAHANHEQARWVESGGTYERRKAAPDRSRDTERRRALQRPPAAPLNGPARPQVPPHGARPLDVSSA